MTSLVNKKIGAKKSAVDRTKIIDSCCVLGVKHSLVRADQTILHSDIRVQKFAASSGDVFHLETKESKNRNFLTR